MTTQTLFLYFGFAPFVGQEIVFQNGKAIWSVNYYGRKVDKKYPGTQVYAFLQKAMRQLTLGLTVTPAAGRSEVEIVIATLKRQIQEKRGYGGHPKNVPTWGANTALDLLRTELK